LEDSLIDSCYNFFDYDQPGDYLDDSSVEADGVEVSTCPSEKVLTIFENDFFYGLFTFFYPFLVIVLLFRASTPLYF